jgi:DNA-binding transcriptional ArsR family regulator
MRTPLAPELDNTGLAGRTAALLRWIWEHTNATDWPRRQRILRAAEPVSTSGLTAATDMPLGTAGSHLRILLEAGLLQRRRSGREVLYWWSDSAHALVSGAFP